ncbi:MAG: HEAT repeat domain-containing protein [Planctomycetota bacterium]
MREFVRQLSIVEKNLTLYPPYGRIVRESLEKLHACARCLLRDAGAVRLEVTQDRMLFQKAPAYEEAERGRNLAFRLHKDGVREVVFDQDLTIEELRDFLVCLKEARKVDEEDDDFVTMFWEKDAHNIELRLSDDLLSSDDIPTVPEARSLLGHFSLERFGITPEEKEELTRALESRKAEDASSPFEISDDDAQKIRDMVAAEARYIALLDFADILLEVMTRDQKSDGLSRAVKMIRAIIASVVEDLDFGQAALLMQRFSGEFHPALAEEHRRELREMLETFKDKQTLLILETYLKENDRLAPDHEVFKFMKAFPKSAAESFCSFLRFEKQTAGIAQVLVHLASGQLDKYAEYLEDPDPMVVRAMIGVLLEADKEAPVKRIARALRHPDESVRVSCARAVLERGDASAGPLFLPLLADPSAQILNLALEFFVKIPYPPAFERLRSLAKSKVFLALDHKRKRLCFTAILKSSPARGFDFIAGSVLRWPFSWSKLSREKKSAALEALALTGSERAREVLERWAARKRSGLSGAAQQALRTLAAIEAKSSAASAPAAAKAEVSHA